MNIVYINLGVYIILDKQNKLYKEEGKWITLYQKEREPKEMEILKEDAKIDFEYIAQKMDITKYIYTKMKITH